MISRPRRRPPPRRRRRREREAESADCARVLVLRAGVGVTRGCQSVLRVTVRVAYLLTGTVRICKQCEIREHRLERKTMKKRLAQFVLHRVRWTRGLRNEYNIHLLYGDNRTKI
jgi:hypothetical protein